MNQKPVINYRQKTLLGLLQAFKGQLPRRDFQKYLFLFTKEFEEQPSFEFIPYKYGCFSFQSYADKRRLVEIGALVEADDWRLNNDFRNNGLTNDSLFDRFHKKYAGLKGDELVQDVYRRYPYFAINSEIAPRLMDKQAIASIAAARPQEENPGFFTIGYEGSSFEGYLNRLIKNNVKMLVDVRRNPLSRKYGFSKKTLSETVEKLSIEYVHIPELGIMSDKRQELNTQADYDHLFASYEKNELRKNRSFLNELVKLVEKHKRLAITCFEADVCMCHRGRVAKVLQQHPDWQYDVIHI